MWPFVPNFQKLLEMAAVGDSRATMGLCLALNVYGNLPEKRQAAANALGQIGDTRAINPLRAALNDWDANVRGAAAKALARIGPPAVTVLCATLQDGEDSAREAAVAALVNIGEPALEPLLQCFASTNTKTRQFAARALGKMVGELPDLARAHTPTCEATCIAALQDTSAEVRDSAARLLGRMRCRGSADALAKLMESTDPGTRNAAARSLIELGDPRGDRFVAAAQAVRDGRLQEAIETLVALSEEANVDYTGRLRDPTGIGWPHFPCSHALFAITVGLSGQSERAKQIISELSGSLKYDYTPKARAEILVDAAHAYWSIGDQTAAHKSLEAATREAQPGLPGEKVAVFIYAAGEAHAASDNEAMGSMLAEARTAARDMRRVVFTDRSGSFGAGTREHLLSADGLAKKLLEQVAAAEETITASPLGVGATYLELANQFGSRPGLPKFLSAIGSDIPAAIVAASEITESYCRGVAILIVTAKLRGC